MRICIHIGKQFEGSSENRHRRKDQCEFASAHVNSLRTHLKVKSHINVTSVIMHALIHVRLKNAVKRSNQFYYASIPTSHLRKHLKTHSGQKLNRCSQCNAQCVHSRIRFSCIQNCERRKKGWQWGRSIFSQRHVGPILGVSFSFSVFGRLSPWVTIGEE